jgi:hypothetical protein
MSTIVANYEPTIDEGYGLESDPVNWANMLFAPPVPILHAVAKSDRILGEDLLKWRTNNCCTYAVNEWNRVTGDSLSSSAYGVADVPSALRKEIRFRREYAAYAREFDWPSVMYFPEWKGPLPEEDSQ